MASKLRLSNIHISTQKSNKQLNPMNLESYRYGGESVQNNPNGRPPLPILFPGISPRGLDSARNDTGL